MTLSTEELDERIRLLVTEVADAAPPAPSLPQLDMTSTDHGAISQRRSTRPIVLRLATVGAVVVVIAAVLTLNLTQGSTPRQVQKVGRSPAWRLVASLSGPQFVIASGTPQGITGATCGAPTACFLSTVYSADIAGGGSLYVSHDGGQTWTPAGLPATTAATTLASCGSADWCAVGGGLLDPKTGDPAAKKPMRDPVLLVTKDRGRTWTDSVVPLPVSVQALPAYNGLPAETTYWPGEIDSVSCDAPGRCDVLGHSQTDRNSGLGNADELVFLRTVDGGAHWKSTILPERPSEQTFQTVNTGGGSISMACPSELDCVVAANLFPPLLIQNGVIDAWRTSDGGRSWSESLVANGGTLVPYSPITCPTTSECWIVPQEFTDAPGVLPPAHLFTSIDGGRMWDKVPVLVSGVDLSAGFQWRSISCPTSRECFLGGLMSEPVESTTTHCRISHTCYMTKAAIAQTNDGGKSWQLVTLPSGVGAVANVSCNPDRSCVAVAASSSPGLFDQGAIVLTNGAGPGATDRRGHEANG